MLNRLHRVGSDIIEMSLLITSKIPRAIHTVASVSPVIDRFKKRDSIIHSYGGRSLLLVGPLNRINPAIEVSYRSGYVPKESKIITYFM